MQPTTAPFPAARVRARSALIASADRNFRRRLSETLSGLRWQVREAEGGAAAFDAAVTAPPEALVVDSWLPDLDHGEFLSSFRESFPEVDLIVAHGPAVEEGRKSPHRQEILYALRRNEEVDTASWNAAPAISDRKESSMSSLSNPSTCGSTIDPKQRNLAAGAPIPPTASFPLQESGARSEARTGACAHPASAERLPELVGNAPCMIEVSRRIRLVAPRMTPVLIEGPTGSGKELVAEALHRLSSRSRKPFVAINCAAIPEALLEAELFGHTRGAFTGAVQGRVGRIEAADGGTLFLDEIGEMPLALQAKLLRFVESGELQRVGDNETLKVDVRILAVTHRPLAQHTQAGTFRADLYYRLAVFLIRTPALADHPEDLPLLVDHFLEKMGRSEPVKGIEPATLEKLKAHSWPGNVRELEHVLERAGILAGDAPILTPREIDFGVCFD